MPALSMAEEPAIPTAFETRDAGVLMEAHLVLAPDERSVKATWELDYTSFRELQNYGKRKSPSGNEYNVLMPDFDSIRPAGKYRIPVGTWVTGSVGRADHDSDKRLVILLRCDVLR